VQGFGRFKPAEVPILGGSDCLGFIVDDPTGKSHTYACLTHPSTDKCIIARRDYELTPEGLRDYN
jgi:hypothetical protein